MSQWVIFLQMLCLDSTLFVCFAHFKCRMCVHFQNISVNIIEIRKNIQGLQVRWNLKSGVAQC